MRKDAAARAAILAVLERELKKGDKALVGNKGYRRFLMKPDHGHFAIDQAKAEEDAKFDGVFVLRTNARLSPLEAMLVTSSYGRWTSTRHGDSQESRVGGFGVTLGSRARRNGRGVARAALSLAIVAASAVTSLLKVPSTSTERLLRRPF